MSLPALSDELIFKVLEANPNTVVFIQSGTPVAMPWASKAKSIVHAWYRETRLVMVSLIFYMAMSTL